MLASQEDNLNSNGRNCQTLLEEDALLFGLVSLFVTQL